MVHQGQWQHFEMPVLCPKCISAAPVNTYITKKSAKIMLSFESGKAMEGMSPSNSSRSMKYDASTTHQLGDCAALADDPTAVALNNVHQETIN